MAMIERVTVTLPAGLVESIDRLEHNRSRFIAASLTKATLIERTR